MTPRASLLLICAIVALFGAAPHAGGWNDGSRLAAAESLAERGTWVIDDSVFVRTPDTGRSRIHPYSFEARGAQQFGTLDKLRIDGHYYSDKSPVPNLLLAGLYRGWLAAGGWTVRQSPGDVIRFLTFATSGVAYLLAVAAVWRLGELAGLRGKPLLILAGSFALATAAPAYSRYVNSHVLLLAAVAWMCVDLAAVQAGENWRFAVARAGMLAGFGYTCDLGAGPVFLAAAGAFVLHQTRRPSALLAFGAAALPWLTLHHALNYAIGGTIGPANAVPAYLDWPGSPFTEATMTGGLKHTPAGFVTYSLDLLFGQKGIISNNLPLWLAFAGGVRLLARRDERPAVLFAFGACGAVWLLYAATSNNFSGQCVSVRWFVPFLAPGFWLLARLIAREPRYHADLRWLAGVGLGVAALQFAYGTWMPRMVPGFWGWLAVAGVGWAAVTRRHSAPHSSLPTRRSPLLKRRSSSAA